MKLEIRNIVIEDLSPGEIAALRRQLGAGSSESVPNVKRVAHLTTKEAAARLGMSPEYLRDHATELGGVKRGNCWRFDPAKLVPEVQAPASTKLPASQRRRRKPQTREILAVRGERP